MNMAVINLNWHLCTKPSKALKACIISGMFLLGGDGADLMQNMKINTQPTTTMISLRINLIGPILKNIQNVYELYNASMCFTAL